jgi:predicted kinase
MEIEDALPALDRREVVSLIRKHANKLAQLANEQGCMTLYYLLDTAVAEADRELGRASQDRESGSRQNGPG